LRNILSKILAANVGALRRWYAAVLSGWRQQYQFGEIITECTKLELIIGVFLLIIVGDNNTVVGTLSAGCAV
jgi:hypothetical protein